MSDTPPVYLDKVTQEHLTDGIKYFYELQLDKVSIYEAVNKVYEIIWRSDNIVITLAALLRRAGLDAGYNNLTISVHNGSINGFTMR